MTDKTTMTFNGPIGVIQTNDGATVRVIMTDECVMASEIKESLDTKLESIFGDNGWSMATRRSITKKLINEIGLERDRFKELWQTLADLWQKKYPGDIRADEVVAKARAFDAIRDEAEHLERIRREVAK